MREHLPERPIEIERAAVRECHRGVTGLAHARRPQRRQHGQADTAACAICGIVEIRQRRGIACGARRERRAEGRQRFERHDPRADRAGKILGEERPEWLILPGLHVARRPVVQDAHAEEIIVDFAEWNRCAHRVAGPDDGGQFKLVVERARRPDGRCGIMRAFALSTRPPHFGA